MSIKEYIKKNIETKEKILTDEKLLSLINEAAEVIVQAYKRGNKVLTAGNGGSAADAQHIAGELVSKLYLNRPSLPAYALTTNSSIITAISNDYGYKNVFARQLNGMGVKGDVFLCLTTSGNSENISVALEEARTQGLISIGFTGEKPCAIDSTCDYLIKVPSADTPQIQECHIMLGHIICDIVEKSLFNV